MEIDIDEKVLKAINDLRAFMFETVYESKTILEDAERVNRIVSTIFEYLMKHKEIIEETKDYTDEYWFDKLNLRNSFKTNMFNFIGEEFPIYKTLYDDIYNKKDSKYFTDLSEDISKYCKSNGITYKDFSAGT